MIRLLFFTLLILLPGIHNPVNAQTLKNSPTKPTKSEQKPIANNSSISSNPAAVNVTTGSGVLQRYLENKLSIQNNHGIMLQGAWIGDTNRLFSGGIPDADLVTSNSVLLVDLTVDMGQFTGWDGGLFSAQFLQQNAQNTNAQAGIIQGYNSLPDVYPFNRSELYALWYRQELFDKKLFVRIGKTITTLDFNNVIKPAPLSSDAPNIPAVTSLIYTPIFINPEVDGIMPGYTNTAYGITLTLAPISQWYLSYGIYDGNLASGKQTGLTGPTFNGRYFQVSEMGGAWVLGKNHLPGTAGLGIWHQTGLIRQHNLTEMEATGAYLFGSQRLWYRHPGYDTSGISAFYQYGINNSSVLPMKQSVGGGLTLFGLIAHREGDSLGAGFSLAWLNQRITDRSSELMYQIYYQAKIINNIYLEPVLSYIPTPGQNANLPPAFAGTLRAIVLA
ncbi:Carbohydrate-selective porin, OprB family [Legionella cherrii]|uniref:Carbohydrate-selective porin, OprB family n=1 Tax=Legionella cherrii TaxID=28084 RepID=A0A0W0S9E3_9GAMM|nr:carbohydrate porin [Legionella cherrii]KTC79729.1 Carbohydrate-selective porin, OprB family [Legionella cherrii]